MLWWQPFNRRTKQSTKLLPTSVITRLTAYGDHIADLPSIERRKLEWLFRMGTGYMLDFSDRTFIEFFEEHCR